MLTIGHNVKVHADEWTQVYSDQSFLDVPDLSPQLSYLHIQTQSFQLQWPCLLFVLVLLTFLLLWFKFHGNAVRLSVTSLACAKTALAKVFHQWLV